MQNVVPLLKACVFKPVQLQIDNIPLTQQYSYTKNR